MTLGLASRQFELADPVDEFCRGQVADDSIFGLLHRERDRLFPDEMFADLYRGSGRRSVPPSILACVMVLQRLEGLSDREAADRFTYDARWRYACGVGGWESGPVSFVHTVLVRFRMRLEASDDPRRIFKVSTAVAAEAGLVGVRRVLDSAPLFDAVATQDTVTLIRSSIRGLLRAADPALGKRLREALSGHDDYAGAGKPPCDWTDPDARAQLVDRLARDGLALLGVLEGRRLPAKVVEAAELVATVIGQDLEADDDGSFRIARRVATDRVISTVDPEARHGRKSTSGKFDGFKGHIALDPDYEIITGTVVGPANRGDAEMTATLTEDLGDIPADTDIHRTADTDTNEPDADEPAPVVDHDGDGDDEAAENSDSDANGQTDSEPTGHDDTDDDARPAVYGDAAYGSGDNLADLEARGIRAMTKTQPPISRDGRFSKDDFDIDLDTDTVTCPAGQTAPIARGDDGAGTARFGSRCGTCPLRDQCTTARSGRSITVHRHERLLAAQRARQRDPDWQHDYRSTRPKVERKLAHKIRRGRRARRRGLDRVDADWNLLGAAVNLARLAVLGVHHHAGSWQTDPA